MRAEPRARRLPARLSGRRAASSSLSRRAGALLFTALAATGLGGCRPLYVPLVPDDAPAPVARTQLAAESELLLVGGRPSLSLIVTSVAAEAAEGDWLAVQWFGPSGALAASDSRWLDASSEGTTFTFELPPDVELASGEWRAVSSLGGFVLRQFRVDVAINPER